MSVDEIISKVKQGELKIQLDSGDMVEKKSTSPSKMEAKNLKKYSEENLKTTITY